MRLCVCGGRDFNDLDYAVTKIHEIHLETPVSVLINGMAKGADAIARAWANHVGVPIEEYWADWSAYGRAAGMIRNKRMLLEGRPDLVLGLPGGRGTRNMINIARTAGIRVIELTWADYEEPSSVEAGSGAS